MTQSFTQKKLEEFDESIIGNVCRGVLTHEESKMLKSFLTQSIDEAYREGRERGIKYGIVRGEAEEATRWGENEGGRIEMLLEEEIQEARAEERNKLSDNINYTIGRLERVVTENAVMDSELRYVIVLLKQSLDNSVDKV